MINPLTLYEEINQRDNYLSQYFLNCMGYLCGSVIANIPIQY